MKFKALVILSMTLISSQSFGESFFNIDDLQHNENNSTPISKCKVYVYWTDYDRDGHSRIVEESITTQDDHSLQDCLILANSNHEKAKKDFGKRYLYTTYHFESDNGESVDGKLIP